MILGAFGTLKSYEIIFRRFRDTVKSYEMILGALVTL